MKIVVFLFLCMFLGCHTADKPFDTNVQTRLHQNGFSDVRNIRTLNEALQKKPAPTPMQIEVLMCVPDEKFRQNLMTAFISNSPQLQKTVKAGHIDDAKEWLKTKFSYSDSFIAEVIKCVQDDNYMPKQIIE